MVRITKARRPRMRPRSSLTPMAAIPPVARPTASQRLRPDMGWLLAGAGSADVVAAGRSVTSGAGASSTGSVTPSMSGRLHGFAVGGGHLQEQLLEVARGAREAHDRETGRDRL